MLLSAGAAAFFFIVGLDEIDVPGFLAAARGRYLAAAALAVGVAVLAGLAVTADLAGAGFNLGLDLDAALALAGILALSSVGVVSAVLAGKGLLRELVGLRLFTTVIIAEALALLLVAGDHQWVRPGRGARRRPGAARYHRRLRAGRAGLRRDPAAARGSLLRRLPGAPVLSFALLAGSLALAAVAAGAIGLNGLLGALLLGACLSDLPHRTRDDLLPGVRRAADAVFVPLLFASAGLHLTCRSPACRLPHRGAGVHSLAGKFAGALLGARLAGLDTRSPGDGVDGQGDDRDRAPGGAAPDRRHRREVFSLLVLVMFGYILLAPRPWARRSTVPARGPPGPPADGAAGRSPGTRWPASRSTRSWTARASIPARSCRYAVSSKHGPCRISTTTWSWRTALPRASCR